MENFLLKKSLTMPKKTERGTLWDFSTSILLKNSKKNEGGGAFRGGPCRSL